MEGQVGVMLTIKTDGTLDPLGLKWTNESRFELMPPTRDNRESVYADGEIDFGTELETGEIELHCVSDEGLTKAEINTLKAALAGQLNSLRSYNLLCWECDQDKALYVRLARRPETTDHPGWFEITIPLKYKPIWVSTVEHCLIGSGSINNAGTFDAPLIIEIKGPATNPEVTVGGEVLSYNGTLGANDVLTINTGAKTVKLNNINALANFTGKVGLQVPPGQTAVAATETTTIKWRDCWI